MPETTELTEPFWKEAGRGHVAIQRCRNCGLVWHPPEPFCPANIEHEIEWVVSKGSGSLYSYTEVQHVVHPAVTDAVPYIVALVELDEGVRVICNLVDAQSDEIIPFARVQIDLGEAAGGLNLPVARLERSRV